MYIYTQKNKMFELKSNISYPEEIRKIKLKGMTLEELQEFFKSINEPKYKANQLFNWLYNHLSTDFDEMSNLSKTLRQYLNENTIINTLELVDSEKSSFNDTTKFIFKTNEGNFIESVVIPEDKRITLCLSTQVGCPLDCKFCATGLMGYKKNLTAGEIFDQYLLAQKNYGKEITNIVYMGMGEPLLNFNETIKSLKIFSEQTTTGISTKKITISTAGIAPKIKELSDSGIKVKLAFSLHSCFDEIRNKIMPINKKYPLKKNIEALIEYSRKTKTRITFEYIMLKDINDRNEDLNALIKLCKTLPSKINIIPFNSLKHMNPTGISSQLEPTSKVRILEFAGKLRENNITVMLRNTQGEDIAAACGQLAVRY
ncbi:MAG: 23S rRNA (adenine(2503)-C(2))-methyltransferase RlmN [Ignavibacterium sp.]